ncbi:MAG: acyl carrier protein [Planctomycetaceae bacterium]|nr:acyl carrier protein [Planctomycetaceae bacterium]
MDLAKFCLQMDELFELDEGTTQPTDELQQISGWSSLTFMGLIALVDEEYGVTLAPNAVLNCVSIADLARLTAGDSQTLRRAA